MQQDKQEYVGLSEASDILGISKQTINSHMVNGNFPIPIQRLKATPLWTREQILEHKEYRKRKKKKTY